MSEKTTQIEPWRIQEVSQYDIPINFIPDTVLDIGANIGVFSHIASKRWPQAKIISYEPMPENGKKFSELNKGSRFEFHLAAVTGRDATEMDIFVGDMDVTNSFHKGRRQTESKISVHCVNSKNIPSCDFVKIDTEGCELEIVSGMDFSKTKAVVCEFHLDDSEDIKSIMSSKGFELWMQTNEPNGHGLLKFAKPGCIKESQSDTNGKSLSTGQIPTGKAMRSVFLATTALWSIDPNFFQCCLRMQQELLSKALKGTSVINGRFPELYAGECPVGRSRNALTANFLKSECTDILFIDSDLVFSAEQIERIVLHEEEVVGGCYMLKREGTPQICLNHKPNVNGPRPDGLIEVNYIGTGFLRIRREVFEKMIAAFGEEIWYRTDDGRDELQHDFWRMGVYEYHNKTRRWLSEDWWFSQKCQEIGIPVYADMNILLGHSGSAVYPLSYQRDFLYPKQNLAALVVEGAGAEPRFPQRETAPALSTK